MPIIAAIAAGALALTACAGGGGSTAPSTENRTLSLANLQNLASFDTGQLDTGWQVYYWQPVYDTLLNYTPEGVVEPNLATSFEYNEDNTVLTLTLREGITFTDGEPFDAAAVKANIEHLQQSTGVSVYMVAGVTDVVVLDDVTVEIHLDAPDPAFTYYLCLVAGAMASPAALGTPEIAAVPVGSGPYVLDTGATITGSEYVFTRNEDYWNPDAFPYDTFIVKPMEDLTARVNALKSGQVNGATADTTVIAEAEASNLQVGRNPISWRGLVLFDRDGEMVPELADVRVRQAINYALDSEAILENIFAGRAARPRRSSTS
nr:ABC transporter substrate-binding protein [Microbacterium sp. NIBRBAC000506063]